MCSRLKFQNYIVISGVLYSISSARLQIIFWYINGCPSTQKDVIGLRSRVRSLERIPWHHARRFNSSAFHTGRNTDHGSMIPISPYWESGYNYCLHGNTEWDWSAVEVPSSHESACQNIDRMGPRHQQLHTVEGGLACTRRTRKDGLYGTRYSSTWNPCKET